MMKSYDEEKTRDMVDKLENQVASFSLALREGGHKAKLRHHLYYCLRHIRKIFKELNKETKQNEQKHNNPNK